MASSHCFWSSQNLVRINLSADSGLFARLILWITRPVKLAG